MFVSKEDFFNGIHFWAIQSNRFKASALVFSVTIPLSPERMAHQLLLSGLLRRGTHELPSMSALNRRLDELYGSYVEIRSSTVGNNLCLTVSTEILDNRYVPDRTDVIGGVIDIISQILLSPHLLDHNFDPQLFTHEQKIVCENLEAEKNNTRSYSIKRCAELLGEATTCSPNYDHLKALVKDSSLKDVKQHYEQLILPSVFDVFYLGASEPSVICEKISRSFSTKTYAKPKNIIPLKPYKRNEFCFVKEKMAVSQGKLALGFSTGITASANNDKYYTALLLNEIFGGSASSKLFVNVREKMSLCYYCSSSYSIYTGAIMVSCGIEPDKFEIAKSAILAQLDDIRKGNVSQYEFDAAKKSISNSYLQLYDSPFDIHSFYSGRKLFNINDSIEDCVAKLTAVTLDDVIKLSADISLDAVFFVESIEDINRPEEDI